MAPREGHIGFKADGVSYPCSIWYRISGLWPAIESARPLLVLHGGPGYTHDYMLPLEDLCRPPFNLTVIFFDQLGSGKSTHMKDKLLDFNFWTEQFFLDQVKSVICHLGIENCYDLIGHSWGGMLATLHAARQPQGLHKLVIAHAPSDSRFWAEKYNEFRNCMPEPHRSILKKPRTVDSEVDSEYSQAIEAFYKRHFIKVDPVPSELLRSWEEIEADPTATLSTLGPDEFCMTGSMAGFTAINDVTNIKAKTLVLHGTDEGCDHAESMKVFQQINDCIVMKFHESTHFAHFEERKKFMEIVAKFLI